ncbi:MAG: DMT family transporter [Wenzhouxiangellaceae bacterium]
MSPYLVALAALCWGISGGIGALLIAGGWDALVVSLYRGAVGLLFVAAWLAWDSRGSGLGDRRLWFWSAVAGLGVAGNFTFYFLSIAEGSVAVAATLMYSAPVFVFVVSFLLGLERITSLKLAAIVAVMFGIVLLTRVYDVEADVVTPAGIGAGLLAGMSYALFIFGFKYAAPHGSPQAILVVAFAVFVVVLLLLNDMGQAASVPGSPDWLMFAALGVLGAGVSFVLYVVGLNATAPAIAALVAMIEPVTASLFGVALLNERLTGLQVFGMVLILVTVTALGVLAASRRAPG